jgi:hypothetical protein
MTNTSSLQFKKLSISDKNLVESITSKFEPYSDFNFTSLFSWDDGTTEVCLLNGNVVIKIADYATGKPVYSILGNANIDESIKQVFSFTDKLELVPEVVVQQITNVNDFNIVEDNNNFDYIYSVKDLALLSGQRSRRKKINRFLTEFGDQVSVKEVDVSHPNSALRLNDVFMRWSRERNKQDEETLHENQAINKLLKNSTYFSLLCLEININNNVVGFSINEFLDSAYAICHFQKSVLSYPNIDVYFTRQVSERIEKAGCKYVNWEQDLGLPGLKQLKMSYRPDHFLKKYTIRRGA